VLTAEAHASCPGHAAAVSEHDPERVSYYCVDPAAHNHSDRWPATPVASTPPTVVNGQMAEAAKAARREVIENTKAWRAAEPVRREWIRTLLARKTAPKVACPGLQDAGRRRHRLVALGS
jgi:ParB family transcriptional regulator, chromosome partitioning protein